MKSLSILMVALTLSLNSLAQTPESTIVERGPHHQVWHTVTAERDERGNPIFSTNVFVELATGLSYLNPNTHQWEESEARFEVTGDGHAVAAKGQHQLILAQNINSGGSVDLFLPDGQRLRSNPMGLSFFDTASGQSVLLGEVKDCMGVLVAPNVMVFADAFTDIRAAIKYSYTKSGFSQDVILLEDAGIGSPSDYGLNPDTTLLEMYSEFHSPPVPVKTATTIGEYVVDETLDFGQTRIGHGVAYVLNEEMESVPVSKTWTKMEGRDFLVESVPYATIKPLLERAGVNGQASRADRKSVEGRKGLVALKEMTQRSKLSDAASVTPARMNGKRGFVLDYSTINTSQTNYVFAGDTTYYLSGNVSLFGSNTTFEGGTVLKYTNSVTLSVSTPVTWQGTSYRPVVLTARDDRSVGDLITPTNTFSGYYATTALYFDANTASSSLTLQNVRVAHAQTAFAINGRSGHVLSHVQLVNCQNGLWATNAEFSLRNALFHNVLTNFTGSSSTGRVEHLSADTAVWLNKDIGTNLFLTNCLLVSVTNTGSYSGTGNQTTSASGVFQTVGQGFHYLAVGSSYRDAGTTVINPALASQLKKMTTFPPIELTDDFSVSATLSPQVGRDINTPDLGYHYDPLDYVWSGLNLTNATLTLTNGVAVATYGSRALYLRKGANLVSEGSPVNLNRIVRYHAVQEQPVLWGASATTLFEIPSTYSPRPTIRLNFTDVSLMAAANSSGSRQLLPSASGNPLSSLALINTSLRGVCLLYYPADSSSVTIALTNSVFERSYFDMQKSYGAQDTPFAVYLRNNLFLNGALTLYYLSGASNPNWEVRDNSFDKVSPTQNDASGHILKSYNAYINATSLGGTSNVTVTNFTYAPGPLGPWYHSSTNLIDKGSRTAADAGLYHFTTRIDQTRETNSTVDIGFHYAAIAKIVFIGTDSTTLGDWKGIYGLEGYNVLQDTSSYPSYATVTPTGIAGYTWDGAPTDTRALLRSSTGRIAACWYSGTYFDIALTQNDGVPHRLAIYNLDWDTSLRKQTFEIKDSVTGSVLDTRSITNFNGGQYLVWDIYGDATIRVTNDAPGYNAVISGLFFDFTSPTPTDGDGDGLADYLEDLNGNGSVNSGETDWQSASDLGLKVWITEPKSNSNVP
jgi:hypothetical protein